MIFLIITDHYLPLSMLFMQPWGLLSDDGARITGQVLPVDGGHELFENHQVKKLIAAFVCNLLPLNVSLVLENVVTFIFSSMWWFRL